MTRLLPYTVAAVVSSALTAALILVAPGSAASGWAWLVGDESASVGRHTDSSDLWVNTGRDFNLEANHIRLGGRDGNFEFESFAPESHLNAYTIGTPNRLPLSVGGDDGQDVLSLIVRGRSTGQKKDLQAWQLGGKTVAAVDGHGRLRIGRVALTLTVENGKVVLRAILPNGAHRTLATG